MTGREEGRRATEEKQSARAHRRAGAFALRPFVILATFVLAGVGLAFHTGWGTISSMGWRAISWICPLGAIETLVATGTGLPRAAVVLVVVIAIVLLVGKAFCSWICPVPPFTSIFRSRKNSAGISKASKARAPRKEEPPPSEKPDSSEQASSTVEASGSCSARAHVALSAVGGARDGRRIDTRHWVLGGAILSAAVFGFPVFCLVCPVGLVFATFIALWSLFITHELTWSLVVFPAIVIVEAVLFRRWCHSLCPLGALFSLISQGNRMLRPKVDTEVCLRSSGTDCRACVEVCPEEVDPHTEVIPECSKCGVCARECPAGAISFPLTKKAKRLQTEQGSNT